MGTVYIYPAPDTTGWVIGPKLGNTDSHFSYAYTVGGATSPFDVIEPWLVQNATRDGWTMESQLSVECMCYSK